MSFTVQAEVSKRVLGGSARKHLMLVLADKASDCGGGIYLSYATLARETELGVTTVKRVLRDLEADALVRRAGQRECRYGHTVIWAIDLDALAALPLLRDVSTPHQAHGRPGPQRTPSMVDPVHSGPRPPWTRSVADQVQNIESFDFQATSKSDPVHGGPGPQRTPSTMDPVHAPPSPLLLSPHTPLITTPQPFSPSVLTNFVCSDGAPDEFSAFPDQTPAPQVATMEKNDPSPPKAPRLPETSARDEQFAALWARWQRADLVRRSRRKVAAEQFARLLRGGADPAMIALGAERYLGAAEKTKQGGQFMPALERWLRDEIWRDWIDSASVVLLDESPELWARRVERWRGNPEAWNPVQWGPPPDQPGFRGPVPAPTLRAAGGLL